MIVLGEPGPWRLLRNNYSTFTWNPSLFQPPEQSCHVMITVDHSPPSMTMVHAQATLNLSSLGNRLLFSTLRYQCRFRLSLPWVGTYLNIKPKRCHKTIPNRSIPLRYFSVARSGSIVSWRVSEERPIDRRTYEVDQYSHKFYKYKGLFTPSEIGSENEKIKEQTKKIKE